jgi:hypothetical protein
VTIITTAITLVIITASPAITATLVGLTADILAVASTVAAMPAVMVEGVAATECR